MWRCREYFEWLSAHAPGPIAQTAARLYGPPPVDTGTIATRRGVHRRSLAAGFPSRSVPVLPGAGRIGVARSRHMAHADRMCAECASRNRRRRGWDVRRAASNGSKRCRCFAAEDTDPARIDACETCRVYVKTIDLTRDGRRVRSPTIWPACRSTSGRANRGITEYGRTCSACN